MKTLLNIISWIFGIIAIVMIVTFLYLGFTTTRLCALGQGYIYCTK